MKKIVALMLAVVLILSLGGCVKEPATDNTTSSVESKETPATPAAEANTPDTSTDYDIYVFNTKGENADAMKALTEAYTAETGIKVKIFSLGAGTGSGDALRAEMNSDNKPSIFSVMNSQELIQWEEGGFVMDFNNATVPEFKALADVIPASMRLTSDGKNSFGVPYNVEGYGYIVDTQMVADLFGADKVEGFLADLKSSTYAEWEALVLALDSYIKDGSAATVKLSGKDYALAASKTGLAANLTGVFSTAGSQKWTYGDHFLNVAFNAVFKDANAVQNATDEQIDSFSGALMAYAKALDLKTSYAAGQNGPLPRGNEFISETAASYDGSAQLLADSKAVFLKQGNWAYGNIDKVNHELAQRLTFIPVKMPLTADDIKAEGMTVGKMESSIPVFVPNYYAVNKKVSEEEQKMAQEFLAWMNTSETGKKFITEDMAFIPYNADPATTKLGNSLGNSIVSYIQSGNIITNPYAGAPTGYAGEYVGKFVMENYLTKETWTDEDYQAIVAFAIKSWKELRQQ